MTPNERKQYVRGATGEQKASIEKIATEPTRAALIAEPTGSGKTIVAVYTLLHPLVNAKKTLVICPVSTFDSWRDTLEDHAPAPACV